MAANPTAVEDYVKVIYAHTEWQSEFITTGLLAHRLGLAASSVTEMVKKLVAQGLAVHEPDGTALALRMLRRHRLIETWLVQHVGYGWDEVHDEAEVLEHAVSDRLLDALDAQLGFPLSDPHGDPIPTADGTVTVTPGLLLADATAGGRVVRICDRDPELLRSLESLGIVVGAMINERQRTVLTAEAHASIWVAAP